MADDRLDQKAGKRRCDPQDRQAVDACAERLEDPAHVRRLQGKSDLDPEEAERDVPQARERLARFLDGSGRFMRSLPYAASVCARSPILTRGHAEPLAKGAVKCEGLEKPTP